MKPGQPLLAIMPPNDVEAEEVILGAILIEKGAFDRVADVLKPKMFYQEAHEHIFSAMVSLSDRHVPIDFMTMKDELERKGVLDLIGGAYGLVKLTNKVVSSAHIEAHAEIIKGYFIKRELGRASSMILEHSLDPTISPQENIELAEKLILEIGQNTTSSEMIEMRDVMFNTLNQIEEWGKSDSYVTGVSTGIEELNQVTRGWQQTDLIILGARPSVGKTAIALNFARSAAEAGKTVAVWSLEMKSIMLGLRMLASESSLYMNKLQTGRMDDMEKSTLAQAADTLSKLPVLFDDGMNINIASLKRKARVLKKKRNLGLIIIDYLQLMGSDENKKGNREQEISIISRGLKRIASELEIPVIALSQLSRDKGDDVSWEVGPKVSALRESGAIEQDADLIMMFWGPSDTDLIKDPTLRGRRKLRVAKQRNGILKTIDLKFNEFTQAITMYEESMEGMPDGNWKPVTKSLFNVE